MRHCGGARPLPQDRSPLAELTPSAGSCTPRQAGVADEYEGTVLLVSHDRAFLSEVATRVWAFDGTHLVDFDGPFTEWEADRATGS